MSEAVTKVDESTFESEVIQSKTPVLVDFWAEWCGPCRALAPVLEEIAPSYAGKLKITKLNVDENPDTAARFGVMSIPTLIVFKGGKEASRMVGASSKNELQNRIHRALEE